MAKSIVVPFFFLAGAWILFIGWYAGGPTGLLFPGAIGWAMWLVTAIVCLRVWYSGRRLRRLKRDGISVAALPTSVFVNYGTRVNGMNPYQLKCQGVAPPEFAGHEFISPNLWRNPERLVAMRSTIRIYADPRHPGRYAFDLRDPGLDARPPGARYIPLVFGGTALIFTLTAFGMLLARYGSQYLPESWQSALHATRGTVVSAGPTLGDWKLSVNDCAGDLRNAEMPMLILSNIQEGRHLTFIRALDPSGWHVTLTWNGERRDLVFPGNACRIGGDVHKDGPQLASGWSGSVSVDCSAGGQTLRGSVAVRGCQ